MEVSGPLCLMDRIWDCISATYPPHVWALMSFPPPELVGSKPEVKSKNTTAGSQGRSSGPDKRRRWVERAQGTMGQAHNGQKGETTGKMHFIPEKICGCC